MARHPRDLAADLSEVLIDPLCRQRWADLGVHNSVDGSVKSLCFFLWFKKKLGGAFKHVYVHPYLGKMNPF